MNDTPTILPRSIDFKSTFLSAFRYVVGNGYSTLESLDWYRGTATDDQQEALVRFQVDLADAMAETLQLLGIMHERREARMDCRMALLEWIREAGLIDQATIAKGTPLQHHGCGAADTANSANATNRST